ncbi:MAG: tyrosine-type recombinase/integrase [Myxococcales bacterium]|nr:tyrosine-type recombinase/integrase [Myxococcales bacterium]MCB9576003.1 tyrosine-type recombinase/integrase [Polyangiaceae bacterium]
MGLDTEDKKAVRNAVVVETLLGTDLRVSEVCDLVVGDVFLDAANVLVRRGKGNKAGLVAISKKLARHSAGFIAWKVCSSRKRPAPAPRSL